MILETKNKKTNLKYRTKKIVEITNMTNSKNFEDLYFNALTENNVEALSKIILVFAEDVDNGLASFKSVDEVFDFIDDLMEEKSVTYQDIFKTIAEDINNMGFFTQKMTKKELENKFKNHLSIDMNEIIKTSAEKAISKVAESEMKISRG